MQRTDMAKSNNARRSPHSKKKKAPKKESGPRQKKKKKTSSARGSKKKARRASAAVKKAPSRKWRLHVVIALSAALGWFVGGYGAVVWPLVAFFAAAVFGLPYPPELRRVADQHKSLAREIKGIDWDGTGKIPFVELGASFLVLGWVVLLAVSLGRYPKPVLLSQTIGSLCVSLGILVRCAVAARSVGVPAVPLEPHPLDAVLKGLPSPGRNFGRRNTLLVGLVVVQAAVGQLMLGGTFGRVLLGPVEDLIVGSVLLSAAGAELVMLTIRHRLLPVADRATTLRKAMKV
jgi:hypothetical protein